MPNVCAQSDGYLRIFLPLAHHPSIFPTWHDFLFHFFLPKLKHPTSHDGFPFLLFKAMDSKVKGTKKTDILMSTNKNL